MAQLRQLCELVGHKDRIWHLSWSYDGKYLASCGGDKTVRIWCNKTGGTLSEWYCIATLEEAQNRTIRACEWSYCGKYIATVSFDSTAVIWEKNGNEFDVLATLEGHENEVKSVSWSPSGELFATCSRDKSIWLWEADPNIDFECVSVLHGHTQDVKYVVWHPSEPLLFSASYDNTIRIWAEVEDDWYCSETLLGHESTVWCIAIENSGNRFVSCSADKNLIIWKRTNPQDNETKSWQRACTLTGYHTRPILSVDWSKCNNAIASAGEDDSICIFREVSSRDENAPSFQLVCHNEKAHLSDVNCIRWHPRDSSLLASCGDDNTVRLWKYTPFD